MEDFSSIELDRELRQVASPRDGRDSGEVAEKFLRDLSDSQIAYLARCELISRIEHVWRSETRFVEKRSELTPKVNLRRYYFRPTRSEQKRRAAKAADPWLKTWHDFRYMTGGPMLRKALRSSFGTQAEIDRWLARERETVPANRLSDWRRFERSCHPVSREAFDREEREREISKLIAATESRVRLELTAELLAASFALGDNSEATWGEATVEQHQQRLDMLIKHAAGTVDTATRHRAAIAMIQAAGATCLAEVAS